MYRESPSTIHHKKEPGPSALDKLAATAFHLVYFTLAPILVIIAVNWVAFSFTQSYYQASWMAPSLLLGGTFLGGVLIRQKGEDETGGMGLFVLGILALILFSGLTYMDIQRIGGLYSQFMPKYLPYTVSDYVFMLPGVGIAGMLFYKYFTLKTYG